MRPSSLAQAIIEPVSETAPISAPSTASSRATGVWLAACSPAARISSSAPIAAALPPPMPLNRATICGMSVIGTRLPQTQFRTMPIAIATSISPRLCKPGKKKVAMTAINMPTPAHWMPLRAVLGLAMRCRPSRNSVAATK